jgi:hypothetical protein
MIRFEEMRELSDENTGRLVALLERGSLLQYVDGESNRVPYELSANMAETDERLRANSWLSPVSRLSRHFAGPYFSYLQSCGLDAMLALAHQAEGEERDIFLAIVLSTASEVVNTIGKHFAQPIRPTNSRGEIKFGLLQGAIRQRAVDPFAVAMSFAERYAEMSVAEASHEAVCMDYEAFLNDQRLSDIAVVYADPPYTRDHYSRFYHVLETMVLSGDPEVSTSNIRSSVPRLSRGLYRRDRHQSPFSIISRAPAAFKILFERISARRIPLVLSYSGYDSGNRSRPRVMQIDAVSTLARRYFPYVSVESAGRFSHAKLNLQGTHAPRDFDAEALIICTFI